MNEPGGRLVLVGTPIGNLDDLSGRALKALKSADIIYCEDTRRARKLLSAMGVPAPRLVRLDQHNEALMAADIARLLAGGATAVLVTDAGMPTISDPGSLVVQAVAEAGLEVEVVPGPTAVSTALALSGLPASRYRFAGFLPRKGRERTAALAALVSEESTTVIYESPNRVIRTVSDLLEVCGSDRPFVAARELTKLHEEVWRGTLGTAREWLGRIESEGEAPRGEWVLVLGGVRLDDRAPVAPELAEPRIRLALLAKMAEGRDRRQAVTEVSVEMAVPKRQVYSIAVALKGGAPGG
jgi:16S rRNA (cytidine1402-2'-O)-methyltransferase